MKVCMIGSTHFPPTEGLATHVWELARYLSNEGHQVIIITRGSKNYKAFDRYDRILVIRPKFLPIYPLHVHLHGLFVGQVINRLDQRIDILHYHSPLPPPIQTKLPSITTFHSLMKANAKNRKIHTIIDFASSLQSNVSYIIERKLVSISKEITVASDDVLKNAQEWFPFNEKQITVIPNGIDTDFFCPESNPLSKTNTKKYLLFVGRLDQGKGLIQLILAMKHVISFRPDLVLKIAGQGPLLDKLNELIDKLELRQNVHYIGQIGSAYEIRQLYRNAYALVCPSKYESGPRVVLECMSCGTPVIGTPVGLIPAVIRDGENGIISQSQDPTFFADEILRLISNPQLRKRMAESAREPIMKDFTLAMMCTRYYEIYQKHFL